MPISDQVIELETKKKGRTVVFIILIALFAAAAVAFAVLWATTEKVAAPPSIEKISVGATDMCLVDDSTEQPVYSVSPQCSYSITLDVVLKDGSVESYDEENNPMLRFSTDPAGAITKLSSSGIYQDNRNRYVFNFRVGALGTTLQEGTVIELMLSSVYSEGVNYKIFLKVEKPYVEYFDIVTQEGKNEKQVKGVSTQKTFELSAVESKTDEHTNFYEVTLPYYSGELEKQNERYEVSFEQFGKTGLNNELAKIMQNVAVEDGKRFDQVKVEVADKENPSESDYKEILDDGGDRTFTHTSNLNLDLNPTPSISNYCRTFFRFWANDDIGSCSSTIRLTANAYNGGSTQYYVIIVVHFESTDDTDAVTQITVYDPYTGAATNELDMYLGDFSSETPFDISQFVKVTVRGKETAPRWGTNYLFGYASDANGVNGNTHITKNPSQTYNFAIAPNSTEWTGDAYVTIEDRNPDGFNVRKTITVHIRPKALSFALSENGKTFSDKIKLNMYSGKSEDVDVRYTIANTLKAENVAENLNTVMGVKYYSDNGKDIRPVFAEKKESKEYEIKNASTAIVVGDLTAQHTVAPEPEADESVSTRINSSLTITVGEEVADGEYRLTFIMHAQALTKGDDAYLPADSMECTITIVVTRLATSMFVDTDYDFAQNEEDKYNEIEGERGAKDATATLKLAAGTGVGGYTVFGLRDILQYFYDEDTQSPILDVANSNFSELKIEALGGAKLENVIGDASHGCQFVMPVKIIADKSIKITMPSGYSLTVTVKYYYAVGMFVFNNANTTHNISYSGNIRSDGIQLGNGMLDDFTIYSTGGQRITSTEELMHPELLNIDVVVLRGANSQYMLPKKFNRANGRWYYFMWGTDVDDDIDWGKAVFRCGYENMLDSAGVSKPHNLSIMKDLFSLSVANMSNNGGGKDIDYQEFCIYYSYGDDVFTTNGEIIQGAKKDYAIYSRYTCERRLDSIRFYETGNYIDEIERVEGSDTTFRVAGLSGSTINVFYSGVIELNDYSELLGVTLGDGYYVESTGKYEFVERKHNIATNGIKLACASIGSSVSSTNESNKLTLIDKTSEQYRVECTKGSTSVLCGKFTCTSSTMECTATLNVYASNRAVAVHEITLYSDEAHENQLTDMVLYNDGTDRVIYYEVCFDEYMGDEETFDSVRFDYSESVFSLTYTTMPEYSTPGDLANETNDRKYVYNGTVTLSAKSGISYADTEKIQISGTASGVSAAVNVKVTTAIDDCFGVREGSNQNKIGFAAAGTEDELNMKANPVPFEYKVGESATFTFDFATCNSTKVDTRNLAFAAQWQGDGVTEKQVKTGGFYWASNYHGMTVAQGDGVNTESFRMEFGAVRVDGGVLKLTVTEVLPTNDDQGVATVTYVLYIKFTVDVPVRRGTLLIGTEEYSSRDSGVKFERHTIAESGTDQYELNYTVNDGDPDLQPFDLTCEYSLEADQYGVFSYSDGKLTIDYSKLTGLSATAKLTVTVRDGATDTQFTLTVPLTVYFEGKEIRFSDDVDGGYIQTNNDNINGAVRVKNKRATEEEWRPVSSVTGARAVYTLENAPAGVSINETTGLIRITNVDKATFTVKVSYTDTYNTQAITRAAEITVNVHANRVLIEDASGNTFITDTYAMLKGSESGEFKVTVSSNIATLTSPSFDVEVEGDAVTVVREDGSDKYKLVANHVGKSTVKIVVNDDGAMERAFSVVVLEPTLTAYVNSPEYNILSTVGYVTVNLRLENGSYDGVEYFTLKDVAELAVVSTDDSAVIGQIKSTASAGTWHVYIQKTEITDASALKAYGVSLSGKIGENYVMNAVESDLFTLTVGNINTDNFHLALAIGGSDVGGNNRYVLNSWITAENYYSLSIGDWPGRASLDKFGDGALEIVYSVTPDGALDFADIDTDGTKVGVVFTDKYIGDATITVTVTFLGRTFTDSVDVTIQDTGNIEGYILSGTVDTELPETVPADFAYVSKSDNRTSVTGTVKMDYDGETAPAKVITLAVNLTNVPVLLNRLNAEDISVTVVGDAVVRRTQTPAEFNGKWFVIEYEAVGAGKVEFTVRATVDDNTYTMPDVGVEFTATAPFKTNGTVVQKELAAGETQTAVLALTPEADFLGTVSYSYGCSSDTLIRVTERKSGNGYSMDIYANTGVDSGSATVTVTATVRGGAFDGKQYVFTVIVSVVGEAAPVVRANGVLAYSDKTTTLDTASVIKVYGISGGTLTLIDPTDYTVELSGNGITKDGNVYKFNAPNGNYANGAVVEIGYKVTITASGANCGRVLSGTFDIAVAPTSVSFTANGSAGNTSVAPYDKLTLATSVGNLASDQYKTVYTLSANQAGSVSDDAFTASLYDGTVKLTATITVTGGRFVGAVYTIEKTVTVNLLKLKQNTTLTCVAGGEVTLSAGMFDAIDSITEVTSTDAYATVDGLKVSVSTDANYGTADKSMIVCVAGTTSGGRKYYGEFVLTVTPLAVPELTVTRSEGEHGETVLTITEVSGASYTFEVLSGDDLIENKVINANVATYTFKQNTAGGTVVIRVALGISGGVYAGGIYDGVTLYKTESFDLDAADMPTDDNLEVSAQDGRISATLVGLDGYYKELTTYEIIRGSGIVLGADGSYAFVPAKSEQKVTVAVTVVVSGTPYKNVTLSREVEIDVPKADMPTLVTTDTEISAMRGSISAATISDGTAATFTYTVESGKRGVITLNGTDYSLLDKAFAGNITVTVTAVLNGGVYEDETLSGTITLTVLPKATVSSVTLERSADDFYTGSLEFTGEGVSVIAYTVSGSESAKYISVAGTDYTITPAADAKTVTLTVWYEITAENWYGLSMSATVNVEVPAAPSLVLTEAGKTVNITLSGCEYGRYTLDSSDYEDMFSYAGGKITVTDYAGARYEEKQVTVTVTATVSDGYFAGMTLTKNITVTVRVERPLDPALTLTEANGAIGITATDCTYKGFSLDDTAYNDMFEYENGNIIINDYAGDRYEEKEVTVTVTASVEDGNDITKDITVTIKVERPLNPALTLTEENGAIEITATDCTYKTYNVSDTKYNGMFKYENGHVSINDYKGENFETREVTVTVTASVEGGNDITEDITVTIKVERPLAPALTLAENDGVIEITATDCTYKRYAVSDTKYNDMFKYENGHIVINDYEGTRSEDKQVTVTVTASVEGGNDITKDITVTIKVEKLPALTLEKTDGAIEITATECTYKRYFLSDSQYATQFSYDQENNRIEYTDYTEGEYEEVSVMVTVIASVEGSGDIYQTVEVTLKVAKPVVGGEDQTND